MTLSENWSVLSKTATDLAAFASALPAEPHLIKARLEIFSARIDKLINLVDESDTDAKDWRKLSKESAELNRDYSRRFQSLMKFADQLEDSSDHEIAKQAAHDIRCLLNGNDDQTIIRSDARTRKV